MSVFICFNQNSSLPIDQTVKIFSYFSISKLAKFREVCKNWKAVLEHQDVEGPLWEKRISKNLFTHFRGIKVAKKQEQQTSIRGLCEKYTIASEAKLIKKIELFLKTLSIRGGMFQCQFLHHPDSYVKIQIKPFQDSLNSGLSEYVVFLKKYPIQEDFLNTDSFIKNMDNCIQGLDSVIEGRMNEKITIKLPGNVEKSKQLRKKIDEMMIPFRERWESEKNRLQVIEKENSKKRIETAIVCIWMVFVLSNFFYKSINV